MSHYSVAVATDDLSGLIDRVLAGEEVVITRQGVPTVTLRMVERSVAAIDIREASARLRARIEGQPALAIPPAKFGDWLYRDDPY